MPGGVFRPTRLEDLVGDVLIATPADGQVLTYSSGTWANGMLPATSPGGSSGQVQYNASGSFAGATGVTYASSVKNFTVVSQHATDVPLSVQMAVGQSGNVFQILKSDGATVGTFIAGNGTFNVRSSVPVAVNAFTVYDDTADFINFQVGRNSGSNFTCQYYVPGTATLLLANSGTGPLTFRASDYTFQLGISGTTGTTASATGGWVFSSLAVGTTPVVARAFAGQTGSLIEAQDSGNNPVWAILKNGAMRPAHLADSAAASDSLYFSTDAGKLVYKDSGGVVNNLY